MNLEVNPEIYSKLRHDLLKFKEQLEKEIRRKKRLIKMAGLILNEHLEAIIDRDGKEVKNDDKGNNNGESNIG